MSVQETELSRKQDVVLLKGAKAQMAESLAKRREDKPIRGWRVYLPLIGALSGLLILISLALWLGTWQVFALGLFFLYAITFAFVVIPTYLLIKGLEAHTRRESMLRRGAIEYLRITSTAGGLSLSVQNELANMESIERDAAGSEKLPRSLYTAFGALPLVGVIVTLVYLRALERVSSAHEKRWTAFVQQASSACSKLSLGASLHPVGTARKDRFVPFCVAAIVFPPSLVVWYNVLIKDSIRHLESQAGEEDLLLQMFA